MVGMTGSKGALEGVRRSRRKLGTTLKLLRGRVEALRRPRREIECLRM